VSRLKNLGIVRRFTKNQLEIADYPGLCRLARLGSPDLPREPS
jgi:GTPase involved in cell partitioning and DNA repair